MSNTSTGKPPTSQTSKKRLIIDEIGRDTKTGIIGRGYSPDNGKTFYVLDTIYGRLYGANDINAIWNNGTSDRVKKMVDSATAEIPAVKLAADEAVKKADSAIASSKVNGDAIVAQSEAISEAKAAMDSATAEIQQTAANAASDAAKIRADVAQVQNEVDTAKAANSASVEALKSDVSAAKQDIQAARQANENVAKQLDDYTKQAQAQGKTIKDIQNAQDGYTATLADVKGNVSKISDAVDGLSASLKDDQDNVATIKAKADELSATLTDHDKNIAQLTASAKELGSTLEDADGRISKVEQTASTLTNEFSDQDGRLSKVEQTATGTQQTVANQQGQINDIKTDISGVHETITGQGNQIATINVTLNGLSSKYEGVEKSGDELKNRLNNLSVGTRNLLHDTSDQYRTLAGDGRLEKSTASDIYTSVANYHGGDYFTYAATITNPSTKNAMLEVCLLDANKNPLSASGQAYPVLVHSDSVAPGIWNIRENISFQITSNTWFIRTYVVFDGDNAPVGSQVQVKDERLVEGSMAGTWSPNPDDVADKITTNSTQIDQNKKAITLKADQTTVDNLSGEVSHNAAQLKVQADQISSKVSSSEYQTLKDKVNGMKVGTRNLLHNTSDQYRTLTGEGWMGVHTSSDEYTSVANYHSGDQFTYAATINNISDVPVYLQVWRCDQNKNRLGTLGISALVQPGQYSMRVSLTGSMDSSTWYLQSAIYSSSGQSGQHTIQVKDERLVEGNIEGTWEANPADIVVSIQKNTTAIDQTNKKISLKADQTEVDKVKGTASENSSRLDTMANEIKSKVTATDVNNIVDGKGYATTSTVQSLITQKAGTINESITSLDAKYSATVTQVQSLTASIDGMQSNVTNFKNDTSSQITQLSNVIQSKVSSSDFNNLRKAVDLQTLDSADINNMKTNGHYFVHNLANNPVGGWVYVDVTGNGADRIRQDVYQDSGNQHKYRRWFGDSWTAWSQGTTESEITQLRDDINLRVKSGDLLSQINVEAGRALFQSKKIFMDADTVVMGPNTKAFIPSAAIENLEADKITTGTLNGIEIRQLETGGRSIDIKNGNIAIASNDPYEPRISFTNDGKNMKMFNALGDIEVLNQEFSLFNFTPEDTHSLNPIPFFKVTNTGQIGSGGAQLNMDHAIFDGYEWWTPSAGVTFGRTWNGVDKSSDYADIYAKSFVPHSELSAKTRIKKLDRKEALDKIMQDDMYTYQFKEDVRDGVSKRYASFIIDNVHDVAQYAEPKEFLSANGKGRDDGTQLAYLIAAVQYQQEQIEELKKKLEEK